MVVLGEAQQGRKRGSLEDAGSSLGGWSKPLSGTYQDMDGIIPTLQGLCTSVVIVDIHGKLIFMNDAAEVMFGHKREQAINKDLIELLCREVDKANAKSIMKMHTEGKNFTGSLPLRRKSGELFIAFVSSTITFNGEGKVAGVISIICDTGIVIPSSLDSEGVGSLDMDMNSPASMPQSKIVIGDSFYGRMKVAICGLVSKAMEILQMPLHPLEKDGPTFRNSAIQDGAVLGIKISKASFSLPKNRLVFQKMMINNGGLGNEQGPALQDTTCGSDMDDADAYFTDASHFEDEDSDDGDFFGTDADEAQASPYADEARASPYADEARASPHADEARASPFLKAIEPKSTYMASLLWPVMKMLEDYAITLKGLEVKQQLNCSTTGGVETTVHLGSLRSLLVAVKRFRLRDLNRNLVVYVAVKVALMELARHPNIVALLGIFTTEEHFGIVTEYMSRGNLYNMLQRGNDLDLCLQIRIALDIARAVAYLHRLQPPIIHNSIRSSTVQLDDKYTAKLGDFRFATMKGSNNSLLGQRHGAPQWVAPEVMLGQNADERSDVYSLGAVLWELFTQRIPWEGLSPMQVVAAVAFQHKQLEMPPSVDRRLAQLIMHCWHRDPALRPSALDVAKELHGMLEGSSTSER